MLVLVRHTGDSIRINGKVASSFAASPCRHTGGSTRLLVAGQKRRTGKEDEPSAGTRGTFLEPTAAAIAAPLIGVAPGSDDDDERPLIPPIPPTIPWAIELPTELTTNQPVQFDPAPTETARNAHTGSNNDGFPGDFHSAVKAAPTLSAAGEVLDHLHGN
ncbi:hypothetical protein ACFW0H_12965 [Pseudomonas sp. CR3202]|uniref:hypothetical protein n=1 Tax=Pseudomonas sp. CR3202 TaxID=3351532 RepID=UPI003BF269E2